MPADPRWLLLVPQTAARLIAQSGTWGRLTARISNPDRAAKIIAVSERDDLPQRVPEDKTHFLASADAHPSGYWYRTGPEAAICAYLAIRQQQALTFQGFRNLLPAARDPGTGWYFAVTYTDDPPEISPGRSLPQFSAWMVSREGVEPMHCDIETESARVTGIAAHWPVTDLQARRVVLIGAGSVGGATATSLAAYGIGDLDIMDPDRLEYHNIPRHVCPSSSVGKHKVNAVADLLERTWPDTRVRPIRANAITDADILRPLIEDSSIVVCTVDGVEPRRVVSYLCKRANKPLVLACVLADGRYGEVLRLRPYREVGCLDCQRRYLAASGRLDLEPTIDRGYGEGTRHNPMTAVGADLHLVGALVAKTAIATILSGAGHSDQLLENDNVVLALRPGPGWAQPFDATRTLAQRWYPSATPYPDCPACGHA